MTDMPKNGKEIADYWMANGENAKHAAIHVGYKEKTAQTQGSRLLNNVKVKEYIAKCKAKVSKKLEITRESQLERLSQLHDLALTPSGEYGNIEIRNAIAAIQEQNKMLGFLAPTKTENKTQMELKDLKPDFGDR